MSEFIFSGFADEIDPMLDTQMRVLKRLSISYLEPRTVDGRNIADFTPLQARQIYSRLQDNGIGVSAVGSPIGKISIEDEFEPHLRRFQNLLEVAAELHCGFIRIFSFYLPAGMDPWSFESRVLDRMACFVRAAEGSGIELLHENEKAIFGDTPQRCLRIHQSLPSILCTFDPSNYVQCGVDTKTAFELLLPHIRYMHMKDSLYTRQGAYRDHGLERVSDSHRPVGQGDGQIPYILKRLRQNGYCGFLSLEPHLSATDMFGKSGEEQFTAAANALRACISQIGE